MRTIPWHRLLPRHHRLLVWWALTGIGVALPWLLSMGGLPLFGAPAAIAGCTVASIYDGDTLRAVCADERLQVRLHCIDAPDGSSSHRLGIFTSNRLNKNKKSGRCSRVATAYNAFAVWRGKRRPSASRRVRCSSSG